LRNEAREFSGERISDHSGSEPRGFDLLEESYRRVDLQDN
jgi:hypothetical protein